MLLAGSRQNRGMSLDLADLESTEAAQLHPTFSEEGLGKATNGRVRCL